MAEAVGGSRGRRLNRPTTLVPSLQASLRQLEARAEELKAAAQGHEARASDAAAELARANTALERLGVGWAGTGGRARGLLECWPGWPCALPARLAPMPL